VILLREWYVLQVRTGEEAAIRDYIKRKLPGINALAPQREMKERKDGKWKIRIRTLFKGYVFVNCNMAVEEYYMLNNITGVISILKGAASSPTPVPEEEMCFVLRLTKDDDLVGITDIVLVGDKVKVASGVLEGYEGQIIKVDKRHFRAKVKFSLMGQEKVIELGIKLVEKIG